MTFAGTLAEVDASRIGVWGSSYSGGHVLVVGAIDRRVKSVVSQVPLISGHRNARKTRVPAWRNEVTLRSVVFTEYEPGAYIVGISRGRRPAAACRSYAD